MKDWKIYENGICEKVNKYSIKL